MITYPNQRVVTIFKTDCDKDFLQIKNEEWQKAGMNIGTYSAFKLYLYFASNMNGYTMACSPADITDKLGISENTYRAAFKELIKCGYLEYKGGNLYWFCTDI